MQLSTSEKASIPARKKNVGLVLPGGGANGAFSAHAANTLYHAGYQFSAVAGISVGGLNGAMISTGQISRLIRVWEEVAHDDIYGREWIVLRALRMLFGSRLGLHHTKHLRQLLDEIYDPMDTQIPFICGAVSLDTKQYVRMLISPKRLPPVSSRGAIRDIVRASASIPGYAEPIERVVYEGEMYYNLVDGGLINVAPLGDLFEVAHEGHADIDRIIVLAPGSVPERPDGRRRGGRRKKVNHVIDVAVRVAKISIGETIYNDVENAVHINELVRQADERGEDLLHPSGRPYRHVPVDIIQAHTPLGAGSDFSPDAYAKRKEYGVNRAKEFIERDAVVA